MGSGISKDKDIPRVEVSRENMVIWKTFARDIVQAEAERRQVDRDVLIRELVLVTGSYGPHPHSMKIMRCYVDPEDSNFFTVTRFNCMLPTLLKWRKLVKKHKKNK